MNLKKTSLKNKDQNNGKIIIIVGMQYGSEGKGHVTSYLSPIVSAGIRTGGTNAAHTGYFRNKKFVMRQIPSVWINPTAKLIIGREAIINLDILLKEIEVTNKILPIKKRLYVDSNAFVVTQDQIISEQKTGLDHRIGSTSTICGKGIGAATADKILRKESCLQAKDVKELRPYLADTVDIANTLLDKDHFILLEGTQGSHLSINYGKFPFVTSRDVSATAIAASAGISTHLFDVDVIGVTRSYPIRVAGNSGPFGKDSIEATWDYVSRVSGATKTGDKIIERTTATKNIRRVATFSKTDFLKSVQVNRPTEIALTFADYIDWSVHNKNKLTDKVQNFIDLLEGSGKIPVTLVGTGPNTIIDFDQYRSIMMRKLRY